MGDRTVKLTLHFVAALRDRLGRSEMVLESPEPLTDSEDVVAWIAARDPDAGAALAHQSVRLIRNNQIAPRPAPVADGDTLAFCPPFSGG